MSIFLKCCSWKFLEKNHKKKSWQLRKSWHIFLFIEGSLNCVERKSKKGLRIIFSLQLYIEDFIRIIFYAVVMANYVPRRNGGNFPKKKIKTSNLAIGSQKNIFILFDYFEAHSSPIFIGRNSTKAFFLHFFFKIQK